MSNTKRHNNSESINSGMDPTSKMVETTSTTSPNKKSKHEVYEGEVRRSIAIKLIRHAESRNNQVYRDARFIYQAGTPAFDLDGWNMYIKQHRTADPSISDLGIEQATMLAEKYLVPHLFNQASHPVQIIVSPMKRTIETLRPTLEGLIKKRTEQLNGQQQPTSSIVGAETKTEPPLCDITVNGFYFESEGCHVNNIAEEGMTPDQIREHLFSNIQQTINERLISSCCNVNFVGFPDSDRGWYCNGTSNETRAESEIRASKFYTWFCDYLDQQLLLSSSDEQCDDDIFDAGVCVVGEEHEDEHDIHTVRMRRRRTAILIGHGDFMSLLLQRIVAGFGHSVENTGIPHRSAFVHWNTGITDIEYFGHGRFLIMSQNATPHIPPSLFCKYRSGGSLKDGWSYIMPNDRSILNQSEVKVVFSDETLPQHIQVQSDALKELYLSSKTSSNISIGCSSSIANDEKTLSVVEEEATTPDTTNQTNKKHFIVKRGLQVVAVASYSDDTGTLYDVAIRPSAGTDASKLLLQAAQDHSKKLGRSGSLLVLPRSTESQDILLQQLDMSVHEHSTTIPTANELK